MQKYLHLYNHTPKEFRDSIRVQNSSREIGETLMIDTETTKI